MDLALYAVWAFAVAAAGGLVGLVLAWMWILVVVTIATGAQAVAKAI